MHEMNINGRRYVERADYDALEARLAHAEACLAEKHLQLAEVERDAAIGRLVRLKLTSGNGVPVERCTIFAHEVTADSAVDGPGEEDGPWAEGWERRSGKA